MSSVDDRIVQMQFDNDQFQKGVAQTNSSLDSLKDHLQLTGATSGFDQIQKSADSMNLGTIADGVAHISDAFSALGTIGINVLSRLTQDAISTGEQLIDKVVGPLVTGGENRAIALQQANFQFQGLGLNIQATMAAALTAVKGTAFGLDDAATAAAQFGASGIVAGAGLEEALRGVAGVAAQTGSSYSDIANIFEEVSGNGRLMGQNLLELSSHGVNAAAALAKSMGTTEANVRAMVTAGKISFTQFSNAMNDSFGANAANANQTFTGSLANMQAALSRLGAEFDTPKIADERDALNALTPVIDAIHAALLPLINAMTAFMGISSANLVKSLNAINLRNLTLIAPGLAESFTNVMAAISSVLTPFKAAFSEIFPPETAAGITALSIAIQNFTHGLILSKTAQTDLKNTFAGFFAIIDIGIQIISGLLKVIGDLFGATTLGNGGILSITGSIGLFLVKVDDAVKSGGFLNDFFKGLETVLRIPISLFETLAQGIGLVIGAITGLVTQKGLDEFASDTEQRFSGLIALGQFFEAVWNGIKTVADAVISVLGPILTVLGGIIEDIANSIGKALSSLNFTDAIQAVNTGLFAGFLFIVNGFFGNLRGALAGNGVAIVASFKKVFGQLQLNLKALELNVDAKTLLLIAGAVALLAASAIGLSLVSPGKLAASMGAITVALTQLLGAFAVIGKIPKTEGFIKIPLIIASLALLAIAIDILAVGMLALSLISWDGIAKGLSVITILLGEMVIVSNLLKSSGPGIIVTAAALLILSVAISAMAGAVAILGALPLDNLIQGLAGITLVLAELVITAELMKSRGPGFAIAAAGILVISGALAIIAGVVSIFAALSIDNLVKGLSALTLVLAEMVITVGLLESSGPGILIAAAALLILSVAINIIAGAVAIMGSMSLDNLVKGLAALAIVLGVVVAALVILSDPMVLVGAAAMLIASAAILVLSGAMKVFGSMSWDSIGRAITLLAATLLILAVALTLMGDPLVLIGAAALIVAGAALALIAPAMALLGTISWDSIGRGLTVLAAAITIMALGGILLIPALPGLLGLATAILLIGIAALAAGIGMSLFAGALTVLVATGSAAIGVIIQAIQAFITTLPQIAVAFALALGTFATTLATQGPAILTALVTVLLSMIEAFDIVIPQLITAATIFILSLVNAIVILVPRLVDAGLQIVNGVLAGIARNIGQLVTQGTNIIVNFINGVANNIPKIIQSGVNLILSFINGLTKAINDNSAKIGKAGGDLAVALVSGMANGIAAGVGQVVRAAERLVENIPSAIKNLLGIHSPSTVTTELGENTGQGVVNGINNMADSVTAASADLGQAAIDGLTSSISGLSAAINDNIDVNPTITPVLDLSQVQSGAGQINGLLSNQTLQVGAVKATAVTANAGVTANSSQQVQTDADGQVVSNSPVTFIQNNNSPKALSNAEIYRQTKNQISVAKGVLTT